MTMTTFDYTDTVDLAAERTGLSIPERFVLAQADVMVAAGRTVEVKRWTNEEGDLLTAYAHAIDKRPALSVSAVRDTAGWKFSQAVRVSTPRETRGDYATAKALVATYA